MDRYEIEDMLSFVHMTSRNEESDIDIKLFPEYDKAELNSMKEIFGCYSKNKILVYPLIRKNTAGELYADIYFFGVMEDDSVDFYRFILEPGKRLPAEDEILYIELCKDSDLVISNRNMQQFIDDIHLHFPEYHFENFHRKQVGMALEAFYFSSHKSVLEVLYKASLAYIAFNIYDISGVDYLGTTPSGIIANIPMGLLRIMNCQNLVEGLFTGEKQDHAMKVYEYFSDYFGKNKVPNYAQWYYLNEIYKTGMRYDKKMYKTLEVSNADVYAHDFLEFAKKKEKYEKFFPIKNFPDFANVGYELHRLEEVEEYAEYEAWYDEGIKAAYEGTDYNFCDDAYTIVVPKGLSDLTREAALQHNCLLTFINSVVAGETHIIFMRKKTNPDAPFITMEVENGDLVQAYGACNRMPTIDEMVFMEKFTYEKGIIFEPWGMHYRVEDLPKDYVDFFESIKIKRGIDTSEKMPASA